MYNIAYIQREENDILGSEITFINALQNIENSNLNIIKHKIIIIILV